MGTKMTHAARAELTSVVRRRYSVATSAQKRKILDEFIAVTGHHEKSAIRALNAEPTVKKRQTRARPSLYDEAARAALIVLWEASDRVCGKRLRARLELGARSVARSEALLTSLPPIVPLRRSADEDRPSYLQNSALLETPRTRAVPRGSRPHVPGRASPAE